MLLIYNVYISPTKDQNKHAELENKQLHAIQSSSVLLMRDSKVFDSLFISIDISMAIYIRPLSLLVIYWLSIRISTIMNNKLINEIHLSNANNPNVLTDHVPNSILSALCISKRPINDACYFYYSLWVYLFIFSPNTTIAGEKMWR